VEDGKMSLVWIAKWQITGTTKYTISISKEGSWGCSCPVWKFRREHCKHISFVDVNRPDPFWVHEDYEWVDDGETKPRIVDKAAARRGEAHDTHPDVDVVDAINKNPAKGFGEAVTEHDEKKAKRQRARNALEEIITNATWRLK
jgi:hypothetical protein